MRIFVVLVVALLIAPPALAISCRDWERLDSGQKRAEIDYMIESAIAGQKGREYRVNRGAIQRCLQRYAQSIEYDFDDACADSGTASMQALNRIFKNYIWSCVE